MNKEGKSIWRIPTRDMVCAPLVLGRRLSEEGQRSRETTGVEVVGRVGGMEEG
jgi:hypothetical protein